MDYSEFKQKVFETLQPGSGMDKIHRINEVSKTVTKFLENGGSVSDVFYLFERGLHTPANAENPEKLEDVDLCTLTPEEEKIRILLWSAAYSQNKELAEKGISRLKEFGKAGGYRRGFIRRLRGDMSELVEVLGRDRAEEIDTVLEELLEKLRERKKQVSEQYFSRI